MKRIDIIEATRSWVGTPYHHQQSVKGVGCDCLGLLRGVYRELIGPEPVKMPNYSPGWDESAKLDVMLRLCGEHLREVALSYDEKMGCDRDPLVIPGDASGRQEFLSKLVGHVAVMRIKPRAVAKHCGIIVPDGRFVHAYNGHGVVEVELSDFWASKVVAVFAFPGAR